ncbi:uncharacterized protein LOC119070702 [Bradysia coprophila]|uniref:uncharacterized protein LOC119070702 n=1 Tax=Bradysia coprophila TaxID=38358 RepID=UPI00187DC7AA|nr:uncharacterized protein LOC119070702 [Bradysia coprophila]
MKNTKELSSDSDTDIEKRQRKWQHQRQQKGNKKPKKRGQSNGNGNGKDSDDDFVSTKKVYNSPPKLPNVAAVGRRKNVIPKKPPVSSNVNVNVLDSPPKLPNVAAAPKKPPVSSAAINAALLIATTKDRSSSPSNATAASNPAINITSHRNTTSSIIGSGRTGSTQEVAHPLPIRQSPPPMEYGSEWDTDGEATIAQLKQMQRKRPSKKAHSTSTKPEVKQTPVQSNRKRAASTDEASDAVEATTKRSTSTKRSKASKRSKATKTQQDSADEAGDADQETTKRSTSTKRSKASKRSKVTKTQQDSADEAGDADEATTKRSTSTKRSKASKAQQRKDDDENGNRAVIQTQLEEIIFLGNVFDKSIRRFTCPFATCNVNYSTFLNLKNHVKKTHEETLQKPIETDTNNWRRIQNANNRFDITTVKQKLRPLIIDGETIIKKQRVLEPLATEKTEVATKVFDIMNKQAVELSKLAILFSSLVYFDVYNTISDPENGNEIDRIFEEEFNWKEMILEFKQFQRNTAKAKKPRPAKHNTFFDLCRKYDVETYFTETSQNAWNSIVDTFATNFKTNITTHLYSRIRKWLAFKLRDGKKKKDVCGKENRKDINNKIYHTWDEKET